MGIFKCFIEIYREMSRTCLTKSHSFSGFYTVSQTVRLFPFPEKKYESKAENFDAWKSVEVTLSAQLFGDFDAARENYKFGSFKRKNHIHHTNHRCL